VNSVAALPGSFFPFFPTNNIFLKIIFSLPAFLHWVNSAAGPAGQFFSLQIF
jgi:hypothetical protein